MPRRVHVERNIYETTRGGKRVFEVGCRDSTGKQRWKIVGPKISAARAERDSILGTRGKGGRIQPNPRLRFGEAADRWLEDQVVDLRPRTRETYRNAIETHVRPRWGRRRLDQISIDDAARMVREMEADGKSASTIASTLGVAQRVFKFARRRMNWHGENPIAGLEGRERPKVGTARRRIFEGSELAETLAASHEPYRTLFAFAATTGARLSECLGLIWGDLDLSDLGEADVSFEFQADRNGNRQPLKTDESRRTVELPRALAAMLAKHKARSAHSQEASFVFATRSGRPISQRNASRELRRAMRKACREDGSPTFPALHAVDAEGKPLPIERGELPSFHGFRHLAASQAIRDGESAEEVSWQLGHRNSNVTRAVYVQEIRSAERKAQRRARFEARIGPMLASIPENGRPREIRSLRVQCSNLQIADSGRDREDTKQRRDVRNDRAVGGAEPS